MTDWPHTYTPGVRWDGRDYCTTCGLPHAEHVRRTVDAIGREKAQRALDFLDSLPDERAAAMREIRQPRFESKDTETPGPRTRITLDIAEDSLTHLLNGEPAVEVRLSDNGDGTYGLHGITTFGTTRAAGIKPSADVLVEYLNDLADVIESHGDAVPQPIHDMLATIERRWRNYQGEKRADDA